MFGWYIRGSIRTKARYKKFREKGAWMFPGTAQCFQYIKLPPIISETVKLRTSNVAGTFTGYTSEQNVI